MRGIRLKNVSSGKVMVEVMVSGRPLWKKNFMWSNMDALFSRGNYCSCRWVFVGEKVMSIDVEVSRMRMDFAAIRVNASERFLQSVVQVRADSEFLRSSRKLVAREMRFNLSSLRSLARMARAY